jgi:hypothetical protein
VRKLKNIKIKEHWIKIPVNIVCFLFLSGLTIWGLIRLANVWYIQTIIGVVAFILDVYMWFTLCEAKFLWKKGTGIKFWQGNIQRYKSLKNFFVFGIYTVAYVLLFAIGFYLAEINNTQNTATINQKINNLELDQLKLKQSKANALVKGLDKEVETTYGKKSKELDEESTKLINENEEQLRNLKQNVKNNEQSSKDFLVCLSETYNWDINKLKALLTLILVLLLEYCYISSALDIEIDSKSKVENIDDFKKDLLTWLDAAFDGRSNGALNGVGTISEKTGLSGEKCLQIRRHLSELKVNGGMAVVVEQGVCKTSYTKDFIRNYIINH